MNLWVISELSTSYKQNVDNWISVSGKVIFNFYNYIDVPGLKLYNEKALYLKLSKEQ